MKRSFIPLFVALFICNSLLSQELVLKKGIIIKSIAIKDALNETFSLYLPTAFKNEGSWPILYVFDDKGNHKKALSRFVEIAENENYILAASNNISDTLSISDNVLIAGRMITQVNTILPIHKNRVYTAGVGSGGKLANLMPVLFKNIEGVISSGASIANRELLNSRNPFYFIGTVGKEDFNYTELLSDEKILNSFKFPNNILVFDGGNKWPDKKYLQKGLRLLTLSAMAKGNVNKDSVYVSTAFKEDIELINEFKKNKKMLLADRVFTEMLNIYKPHLNTDSIKKARKIHRKDKLYRSLKRKENATFFKESLLKEDYNYYLEEDLISYNYNNIGWWNYQMTELNKFIYGDSDSEQQMGKRLKSYLNALLEDYINTIKSDKVEDDEALILLSMLKTVTAPKEYPFYLNVISLSSKYEDYGTAVFYLEEALKNGFKDREKLNKLPHTALFRISPDYNKLMEKYLDGALYKTTSE